MRLNLEGPFGLIVNEAAKQIGLTGEEIIGRERIKDHSLRKMSGIDVSDLSSVTVDLRLYKNKDGTYDLGLALLTPPKAAPHLNNGLIKEVTLIEDFKLNHKLDQDNRTDEAANRLVEALFNPTTQDSGVLQGPPMEVLQQAMTLIQENGDTRNGVTSYGYAWDGPYCYINELAKALGYTGTRGLNEAGLVGDLYVEFDEHFLHLYSKGYTHQKRFDLYSGDWTDGEHPTEEIWGTIYYKKYSKAPTGEFYTETDLFKEDSLGKTVRVVG